MTISVLVALLHSLISSVLVSLFKNFFKSKLDLSNLLTFGLDKFVELLIFDFSNSLSIIFSCLSVNFERLKDSGEEKEKTLDIKKTNAKEIKKISKLKEDEIEIEENANSQDKSTKNTNEDNKIILVDKKDEIELTDDINNARKKRRRSSARIE